MQVVVDGLLTNYQKTGNGSVILLLHGWGDDCRTFAKLTSVLSTHYTVIALDLPGFGGSQSPSVPWGINEYTIFVKSFLAKITINKVYVVIGHSFGGAIAGYGVGNKNLLPKKLVLIAASGVRVKSTLRKNTLRTASKIAKVPLYVLPTHKAQAIKLKLYGKIGSDFLLIPNMRETFKKVVSEDIRHVTKNIKIPSLLIYGQKDHEAPPNQGRLLADSIPGSNFIIIEDVGHFIHRDSDEAVERIVKFVEIKS